MPVEKTEPASCGNCKNYENEKCRLDSKPDERGLCDRYEMNEELKKKVVRLLMADVMEQMKSAGIRKK